MTKTFYQPVALAGVVTALLSLALSPARAQPAIASGPAYVTVNAFPFLTFPDPTFLVMEPGTNNFVVAEREGTIECFVNSPATTTKTLMLDLSAHTQGWSDSGILGLAFHPQFGVSGSPNRGYVYVYYVYTPGPLVGSAALPPNHTTPVYDRLSRFTIPDGSNVIDPSSELVLINQFDRDLWHNGGAMFFGSDGYLYLSNGDEGGVNDQYLQSQKVNSGLFSGVLRIDVNQNPVTSHPIRRQPRDGGPPPAGWPSSSSANYYIPNDNPFVDPTGNTLEEFWAIGLRSPHRMTLDPATGVIWLGDVGQDNYEEVDLINKGGNYEWSFMEGFDPGPTARPSVLIGTDSPPIYAYPHLDGNGCVIGGYIYHGTKFASALAGQYIYGDYNSNRIWAMSPPASGGTPVVTYLASLPLPAAIPNVGGNVGGLTTFGLDQNNEIYLCTLGPAASIYTLAAPGSGGRLMNISVKGTAGPQPNPLTAGFVLGAGTGTRPFLIRGVGPTLSSFGVSGALSNPELELIGPSGAILAQDNDWGAASNASAISAASAAVGAFTLPAGSLDAAALVSLGAGQQSMQVYSASSASGVALAEIYDASPSGTNVGPPVTNLSALASVGTNASNGLTAGFVVGGNAPVTLLIRGIGPGLAPFKVANAIADPVLNLYSSAGIVIDTNNSWGDLESTPIAAVAAEVGAFALTPGSADAAILVTLAPGSYTASVSSASGATGVALIEIWLVP